MLDWHLAVGEKEMFPWKKPRNRNEVGGTLEAGKPVGEALTKRAMLRQTRNTQEPTLTESDVSSEGTGSGEFSTRSSVALEEEEWFHGLLARDDIQSLLKKEGDFVTRITEVNQQEKIVISVHSGQTTKHFIINKTRENYFYLERKLFESISVLIRYYLASKEPLTRKSGIVLRNPVPRQSWELSHNQIQERQKLGEGKTDKVASIICHPKL